MAKEKKSADTPAPKPAAKPAVKNAAKKSPDKKAAAKKPVAVEIAAAASASADASTSPVHTAQPSAAQFHEEIRRRAYELYRERGGHHGSHEADWHRAESEVRSKCKA
jgi:hypothetical protein